MKFALVNPAWTFEGSTYFGCREPHYPLELLFAHDQIAAAGHEALVIDAHTHGLTIATRRYFAISSANAMSTLCWPKSIACWPGESITFTSSTKFSEIGGWRFGVGSGSGLGSNRWQGIVQDSPSPQPLSP